MRALRINFPHKTLSAARRAVCLYTKRQERLCVCAVIFYPDIAFILILSRRQRK
jgi:hypothetical protein